MSDKDIDALNHAYARVFSSAEGKKVLDHLVKANLATPIAMQGDDMLSIGVRQGRANLVDEIIQRIVRVDNGV